ncbi:FAD-binding protein [bacterium]|nr:FAD-binding protein [bacterium]
MEKLTQKISFANQTKQKLFPTGRVEKQNFLSVANYKEIVEFSVSDLVCTALAGIKFSDFQSKLNRQNQFFPLIAPKNSTLGGLVASDFRGFYQKKFGTFKDNLLGLKFFDGEGNLLKSGGKVVKNVAGYDLHKLLVGSYGTLGLIFEITLRTYALPENEILLVFEGEKNELLEVVNFCQKLPCDVLELSNQKLYCGFSGREREVLVFSEFLKQNFSKNFKAEFSKEEKAVFLQELTDKFYTEKLAFKILTSISTSKELCKNLDFDFRLDFLTGTFLVETQFWEQVLKLKDFFRFNLKLSRFDFDFPRKLSFSSKEVEKLHFLLKEKFDKNGVFNSLETIGKIS